MKKLGKALIGLIAAVAMLFTGLVTSSTAFAADGQKATITITGVNQGDTFQAWRLMNATQSGTKFAYTEASAAKTAILKTAYNSVKGTGDATLADTSTFTEVVGAISKLANRSETMVKFAKAVKLGIASANIAADVTEVTVTTDGSAYKAVLNDVPAGYYIIEQTNKVEGEDKAASALIVDTAGNEAVTVAAKSDHPTSEKKVKETDDSVVAGTTNPTDWQDGADYDIGDWVPFRITGTLPSDEDFAKKFAAYDKYKFVFHDTARTGLTFDETKSPEGKKLTVKVGDTVIPAKVGEHTNWELKTTGIGKETFQVVLSDIKTLQVKGGNTVTVGAGTSIYVEYYMQLNTGATIGGNGNPNESHLEYSNNPNTDHEGDTGTTPDDKVVVWTYKLDATKKAESATGDDLPGAGFELYKKDTGTTNNEGWKLVEYIYPGTTVKFEFKGIDAGQYKLVEKDVPAGYNKAADVFFTIKATYDTNSNDPKLTKLEVKDVTGGTLTPDKDSCVISTTIVNKSGSELPSTGGMGTVILYVAGAACVIAAGVWFALRRRSTR